MLHWMLISICLHPAPSLCFTPFCILLSFSCSLSLLADFSCSIAIVLRISYMVWLVENTASRLFVCGLVPLVACLFLVFFCLVARFFVLIWSIWFAFATNSTKRIAPALSVRVDQSVSVFVFTFGVFCRTKEIARFVSVCSADCLFALLICTLCPPPSSYFVMAIQNTHTHTHMLTGFVLSNYPSGPSRLAPNQMSH